MSLAKLNEAIRGLPKYADIGDVEKLEKAAGKHIGHEEVKVLKELVQLHPDMFTGDALTRLENLAGVPHVKATTVAPVQFALEKCYRMEVPEPSGLAFVSPEVGFVVAADCGKALWQVRMPTDEGTQPGIKLPFKGSTKEIVGLEGITYDPDTKALVMVSEDRQRLVETSVRGTGEIELGEARLLAQLPDIRTTANKGWEGVCMMQASASPDGKPHLLAVHEGSPRALSVLDRTGRSEQLIKMPEELKAAMIDLADVAVDPKTHHVFLLSDESKCIYEAELRLNVSSTSRKQTWELLPIGKTDIPDLPLNKGAERLQPEGIVFDKKGDMWLAAEGNNGLIHMARKS